MMTSDVHTLSGAYVLHALDEDENAEFERHLLACAACRAEVNEFAGVTDELAALEAIPVPARLREQVLRAASETRQESPLPRLGRTADPAPTVVPLRRRTRVVRAVVGIAASVVAVLGIGFAVTSLDEEPQLTSAVVSVFEAPDVRTAEVATSDGDTVVLAASPTRDEMAIDTRDLHELDGGRVYQLWALEGGQATSVALIGQRGASMPMPETGTVMAITVEPPGGSERPTTVPILKVDPATL